MTRAHRISGGVAVIAAAVLLSAGCGGSSEQLVVQSPDRLQWAALFANLTAVPDPKLVSEIEDAAKTSGARTLDVTVVSTPRGRHVPVVTLESDDPASYMKHSLRGFLDEIGTTRNDWVGFVELVDGDGHFAWSSGRVGNTGMLHVRHDLDSCSPVHHSSPSGVTYPPCPAD
jgi:hypothetical protein